MKRTHSIIGTIALLTMVGCGNKASDKDTPLYDTPDVTADTVEVSYVQDEKMEVVTAASEDEESAKVVRLLKPCGAILYNEVTGELADCTIGLKPGFYNYQGESKGCYLVCVGQDGPYTIPKDFAEVMTWSAEQGHGFVYLCNDRLTTVLLKAEPSDESMTIEEFPAPEGIPDCAECHGITGEWYKVVYNGKSGFVRRNDSQWGVHEPDACGGIR